VFPSACQKHTANVYFSQQLAAKRHHYRDLCKFVIVFRLSIRIVRGAGRSEQEAVWDL
jgi:hypothetical protein